MKLAELKVPVSYSRLEKLVSCALLVLQMPHGKQAKGAVSVELGRINIECGALAFDTVSTGVIGTL